MNIYLRRSCMDHLEGVRKLFRQMTVVKKALTLAEAVEYTGLSRSHLYRLTSLRKIPHSKPMGKLIYFDKEQLDAWLLSNPIRTAEDIEISAQTYISTNKKN